MSSIDNLVARMCPDGVEYKPLGEVGEFIRGNGLQKKDFVDEGVGCIHYGQIYTHYGTSASATKSFVTPEAAMRLRKAQPGDLVVTTTSENVADVGKAVAWLGDEAIAVGGHSCVYSHTLDPLYAAYFFQSDTFHRQKLRFVKGTKVKELAGHELARITMPVPPLDIQRRIAAVLSELERLAADLEAELAAEMEARRSQYLYYRDALLTFGQETVRWTTLTEVAQLGTGSRNSNEAQPAGAYPFFVRSQEVRYLDSFEFDETAIVTSGDGVGVGKVFHFVEGKYALHQRAYRIRITSSELIPKFVFHYMRATFREYMQMTAVHSSVTSVRMPMLKNFPVPVPPLREQQRIASVLDSLDALVDDLSVSLPAEQHARRQQYQYFRDRLLTFEPVAA